MLYPVLTVSNVDTIFSKQKVSNHDRQVTLIYSFDEQSDGSWAMADLDSIIKPGVSAIVLKVLNEAGAKSLGKCIQIKRFQGNRFTKLVISFG